ncbi:type I 3-dehydroquinate dehydratase [bacterium]|nr:type I 3-dehydroquinate dehydratase [bacterium]
MKNNKSKLKKIPSDYDLVEVWNVDLVLLSPKPVLLKITDENLVDADLKVDYIDYDISTKRKLVPEGAKLIISYHNSDYTPSLKELRVIVKEMQKQGADIGKIVTNALKTEDNLIPLQLLAETEFPLISFCMGEKGRISRVMAPKFGSLISYVPPTKEFITAGGQIVLDKWMQIQHIF